MTTAPISWLGRIAQELHLNPQQMQLHELIRYVYYLLTVTATSEFGLILNPPDPVDRCLMQDATPEEEQEENERYLSDLCRAESLNSIDELDNWLTKVAENG